MKVRDYKEEDYGQVKEWLTFRGEHVFHPNILPSTGFIVDNIAAVFLYCTDSDSCYIENLVSSPETTKQEREQAISILLEKCFDEAKALGYKFALAISDHPSVIARGITLGCKIETNKTLLTKQLN